METRAFLDFLEIEDKNTWKRRHNEIRSLLEQIELSIKKVGTKMSPLLFSEVPPKKGFGCRILL